MTTPADYYVRCEARRREALERLEAARCQEPGCRNGAVPVRATLSTYDWTSCPECKGSGCAPGVSYDELRRLEREYERAADTGD